MNLQLVLCSYQVKFLPILNIHSRLGSTSENRQELLFGFLDVRLKTKH